MAELIKKKNKLLVIVAGPTAVGKTSAAIELALKLNAPIISFDSRQFYREMQIGTAKPTIEELNQAHHHFIDHLSIKDHYTAGIYETEALKKLEELFVGSDVVIAVGGSGLYINALCYGIDDIPSDEVIRTELISRWKSEGLETLQEEVKRIDPEFFQNADMQNPRRVIRALEVYNSSGKPYSFYRKNKSKERPFETCWIGLELEREILFARINQRVDKMIEQGLIDEARNLEPHKSLKALRTVGYQEFFDYFENKHDINRAIELVKRNSRIYAKKQLVWFKRNADITWLSPDDLQTMLQLINQKFIK